MQQLTSLISSSNEMGSPTRPPILTNSREYTMWKARFENWISHTDTELWIPILEGYTYPTQMVRGANRIVTQTTMTDDQRKAYNLEKKAYSFLTYGLNKDLFHSFKNCPTSKSLWEAIIKRFEGNDQLKKSRKDLLRKQFEVFSYVNDEDMDSLINRYFHLLSEMSESGLTYTDEEEITRFLDSLPPKYEVEAKFIRRNPEFSTWKINDVTQMILAKEMEQKKRETGNKNTFDQNPALYYGKPTETSSTGSGVAFLTGHEDHEDNQGKSQGEGQTGLSASSGYAKPSSSHHNLSAAAAEDHIAFVSSCWLAYENFIGGNLTSPDVLDENFQQLDPTDIEDIELQHDLANVVSRTKRFIRNSGRKFVGTLSKTRTGFDKSKARCFNCNGLGHFARDCQREKSQSNNQQGYRNNNSRSNSQPSHQTSHQQSNSTSQTVNRSQTQPSNALVVHQEEEYDWGQHLGTLLENLDVGLMVECDGNKLEADSQSDSSSDSGSDSDDDSTVAEKGKETAEDAADRLEIVALMATNGASTSTGQVVSSSESDESYDDIICDYCETAKADKERAETLYQPLFLASLNFKNNLTVLTEKVDKLKFDKHEMFCKMQEQKFHLEVTYKELEEKNLEIA